MHTAQDVMRTALITVHQDATVEGAIRTLIEYNISGAPVVDDLGHLAGIISELQFLEAVYTPEIKTHKVHEFMTKDVLTVTEETLLSEVANTFVLHRIRRVPVLRGQKLVGIITRRDLIRYALESGDSLDTSLTVVKSSADA